MPSAYYGSFDKCEPNYYLTSNSLGSNREKILGNNQHCFPFFIQIFSDYSKLKVLGINMTKMLVVPQDFFNQLNQVDWMLLIRLETGMYFMLFSNMRLLNMN